MALGHSTIITVAKLACGSDWFYIFHPILYPACAGGRKNDDIHFLRPISRVHGKSRRCNSKVVNISVGAFWVTAKGLVVRKNYVSLGIPFFFRQWVLLPWNVQKSLQQTSESLRDLPVEGADSRVFSSMSLRVKWTWSRMVSQAIAG